MDRRSFLKGAATTAAAALPFHAFLARAAAQGGPAHGIGYGPLGPVADATTGLPLLYLPDGFEYVSFGWTGDLMSTGTPTPSSHDGMATFRGVGSNVLLVRNHERGEGSPFGSISTTPEPPAARRPWSSTDAPAS